MLQARRADPLFRHTGRAPAGLVSSAFGAPTRALSLDGDGNVGLSLLSLLAQLLANYGTTGGATYEDCDLDGDEDVDLSDLATLLANYGAGCL